MGRSSWPRPVCAQASGAVATPRWGRKSPPRAGNMRPSPSIRPIPTASWSALRHGLRIPRGWRSFSRCSARGLRRRFRRRCYCSAGVRSTLTMTITFVDRFEDGQFIHRNGSGIRGFGSGARERVFRRPVKLEIERAFEPGQIEQGRMDIRGRHVGLALRELRHSDVLADVVSPVGVDNAAIGAGSAVGFLELRLSPGWDLVIGAACGLTMSSD